MPATTPVDPILIRRATLADRPAIVRLAQLDSSPVPTGDLLLAEVAGELRAALRVEDLAVIADPFAPTQGLVALLASRAGHIQRGSGVRSHLARFEHLWQRAGVLHPSV